MRVVKLITGTVWHAALSETWTYCGWDIRSTSIYGDREITCRVCKRIVLASESDTTFRLLDGSAIITPELTARTQPEDATIRAWLDRAREYPTASGARGWVTDRDGLIALLSECYVGGISASVIPHAVDEDVVTFHVQLSVSFARSELTEHGGRA